MARARLDDAVADGASVRRYLKFQADAQTLTGAVTITDNSGIINAYDCGGSSRNVTMPARAASNDGVVRYFINLSTAGEVLTIKESSTTLVVVPSGSIGMVVATGTVEAPGTRAWMGFLMGGEDLALADDLTVAGDTALTGTLTVTGATSLNGNNTFGAATSKTVGFFGGAGSSQRASSNQASSNAAVSASFGATQLAILQEIMNTLTAHSLWKGAA